MIWKIFSSQILASFVIYTHLHLVVFIFWWVIFEFELTWSSLLVQAWTDVRHNLSEGEGVTDVNTQKVSNKKEILYFLQIFRWILNIKLKQSSEWQWKNTFEFQYMFEIHNAQLSRRLLTRICFGAKVSSWCQNFCSESFSWNLNQQFPK